MPLGVAAWLRSHMPRRARGALFAGKVVMTGNRVSNEYGKKSRRIWKPNVMTSRLWSAALGEEVTLKVTAHALRQIDRAGGLDRYLTRTPDRLLHSDVGSALKFRIGLALRERWGQAAAGERLAAARQLGPGGGGSGGGGSGSSGSSSSGGGGTLLPGGQHTH